MQQGDSFLVSVTLASKCLKSVLTSHYHPFLTYVSMMYCILSSQKRLFGLTAWGVGRKISENIGKVRRLTVAQRQTNLNHHNSPQPGNILLRLGKQHACPIQEHNIYLFSYEVQARGTARIHSKTHASRHINTLTYTPTLNRWGSLPSLDMRQERQLALWVVQAPTDWWWYHRAKKNNNRNWDKV